MTILPKALTSLSFALCFELDCDDQY